MTLNALAAMILVSALFSPQSYEGEYQPIIDESARRDPFTLLPVSVCQQAVMDEEAIILSWQLGGIIGKASDRRVWLRMPDGSWIAAAPQSALPLVYWQLERIQARAAIFSIKESASQLCKSRHWVELKLENPS
ncbi:MAG: hypothetical protein LBN41_01615 [Enterobacteriaceae bacterium]|jgi:pilus assembly protein HofP|nr:hypothetical protein [Enterobacteriaceae bacterium]